MRTGFYTEDYALTQQIAEAVGVEPGKAVPSKVCDAAGTWAAVKVRKLQNRAAANANWDQYYLLGNLADSLERGEI